MTRYIEYLRWQVWLWLVAFGRRVHDRQLSITINTKFPTDTPFARFVDWVSPFRPYGYPFGYERRWLRRLLYLVRHPIRQQRLWSLTLVGSLVKRVAGPPYTFGRYEAADPRRTLKAMWLDEHREYVTDQTGDLQEIARHASLFDDIEVPWSLKPETWLVIDYDNGFVDADDWRAMERFDEVDEHYAMALGQSL